MANGASSIKLIPTKFQSGSITATGTSAAHGLPPDSDEVGIVFNIVSGSAAAITIKLQHSGDGGITWVDLAGASINSLIAAGTAMSFATTPNTGLLRINLSTLTTPASLVGEAQIIYGRKGK